MVFFFDEAHLLFNDAPKALVEKIRQVARLIRSKGVSLWFVTQNPADIPDDILAQIGNRVQHALRGYTPKEQKAIRASADSFRPNPAFDTEDVISQLGVGEALVSLLDSKGIPGVVGRTLIRPPASRLGPAQLSERKAIIADSPFAGVYENTIDRESAYEVLEKRTALEEKEEKEANEKEVEKNTKSKKRSAQRSSGRKSPSKQRGRRKKSAGDHVMHEVKLVVRQIARQHGRTILRGILGSMTRR